MAEDQRVFLTRDEARLVDEALADFLDRLTGSQSAVAAARQMGFRVLVKLSKQLGMVGTVATYVADWALPILQRTYAPDQVTPPKKKAATPRRREDKPAAPFPPARPRAAEPAANPAGGVSGVPGAGESGPVKLSGSAARRVGGLRRAFQRARDKGDMKAAVAYQKRIEEVYASAGAAATHAGELAGD